MAWMTNPATWFSLLLLIALEIILGLDNLIFISILVARLPRHMQTRARQIGLALALGLRVLLLLSLRWIMHLTVPLFRVGGLGFSGRDLILLGGGLFLVVKSGIEIYNKVENREEGGAKPATSGHGTVTLPAMVGQIALIDMVFSLDSVITAVGMANQLGVMIAAVVIAMLFMLLFSSMVSGLLEKHPTIKVLALVFLVVIGINLFAEGLHQHIPKGYTYVALLFSIVVESLNIRMKGNLARNSRLEPKAEAMPAQQAKPISKRVKPLPR